MANSIISQITVNLIHRDIYTSHTSFICKNSCW